MAAPRRFPWAGSALLALTLAVVAWGAGLGWAVWADLSSAERDGAAALLHPRRAIVVLFLLLLPALLAALVWPWVQRWPRAARRLREEVSIVTAAHAGHRVTVAGAAEMRELAQAIDTLAQAHATQQAGLAARIEASNARASREARRLAALMSQLTLGVLVCNRDGRILLYNPRAAQLLEGEDAGAGSARVGLDRPVAGLFDPAAIDHAWQQVRHQIAAGRAQAVAHLVVARPSQPDGTDAGGGLLRVQMVPVDGPGGADPADVADPRGASDANDAGGYVLILDDITRTVEEHGRRSAAWQQLTEGTRAALGNLRAAAQTLQQYPALDAARRAQFTGVVHDEAERLARLLDEALRDAGPGAQTAWPLDDMRSGDLLLALQRSLGAGHRIGCRIDAGELECWVAIDSHAMVQLLLQLIGRVADELGVREVALGLRRHGSFVRLEVAWQGGAVDPARLHEWEAAPLAAAGGGPVVRALDVLQRHGAEIWSRADGARATLCVQLPIAHGGAARQALPRGRPIAYDFDLFHQAGQTAALDDTPLAALSCTVFDTETTGLHPSEGDEIIAIGAVRIVNARLLAQERFDRRVRPRRAVRESARAVHGISTEMLDAEPPLEQVLPPFAQFCEGTVLVAHNAAFDMRFLELARERTGVRFDHPVLDTLLLSSVVHPGHLDDEHHLEQLSARLGVEVVGRHEALGDAIVAGQVFLKLLPLLAERGVVTLGQARAASQRTLHARDRY